MSMMVTATVVSSFAVFASAAVPIDVVVDGYKQSFPDAEPYITSTGTTMVPLRFVSEKLGAEVLWNNKTKIVTINKEGKSLTLKVDGKQAVQVEGRTLVPLRYVSENLDSKVTWDKDAYAIKIESETFQATSKAGQVNLDDWGRIKSDTQNSSDWILMEDVSQLVYLKKLRSVTAIGSTISSKGYFSSGKLYKENADRIAMNVKNYYDLALNVDYRTVTKQGYYNKVLYLLGYAKTPSTTNSYNFVDHVKKNKIITEGYAFPEQSMIYRKDGSTFIRTKFKFRVIQSNDMSQFSMDNFDPSDYSDKAKGIKKGVWYEGWSDVVLYSNIANDQLNTYKVGSTENMFIKGFHSYKELK
ncbi:copper amine oxidase N-terminal domain-containing protein [Paenibacillus sp. USHLN196]|uniref:copper amine oxidase N-terminal domain-containing protein n=1 Tax=Paenibacillus sp. USHLN196 TaxID=3081291 RepID=UPI0030164DD5